MAFDKVIQKYIYTYLEHLPNDSVYAEKFDFIKDEKLRERLIMEFKAARIIYKLFEGLEAENEFLLAQIRTQILMYASIYEAVIHYILFEEFYLDSIEVKNLLIQKTKKELSIPKVQKEKLKKLFFHNEQELIMMYNTTQKRDLTKIRFDEKCRVAEKLGILKKIKLKDGTEIDLVKELIEIYEIRNGIHIHAEIKKEISYELCISKNAYRRIEPFLNQIKEKLKEDQKIRK